MFDIEEDRKICETAKSQKLYTANKYITPNGANFIHDALEGWPRALKEIEKLDMQLRIKLDEEYPEETVGYIVQQLLEEQRKLTCSGYPAMQVSKEILTERFRQIGEEKFSAQVDNQYTEDELARAAAVYALPENIRHYLIKYQIGASDPKNITDNLRNTLWPWSERYWKPSPDNRRRELIKAAALIIAEIERLDRKEALNNAGL